MLKKVHTSQLSQGRSMKMEDGREQNRQSQF
jgi:hypothetical protein